MLNDGQRRAKTAGESQFNQKAWGCLDLIRAYAVSSQITGRKSFTSEKKFNNKRQFTISDSFFGQQIC